MHQLHPCWIDARHQGTADPVVVQLEPLGASGVLEPPLGLQQRHELPLVLLEPRHVARHRGVERLSRERQRLE